LLVILAATAAAPITCAGWETSAAGRQACCQRAHHEHCHDQSAADDCCAKHGNARVGVTAADDAVAAPSGAGTAVFQGRAALGYVATRSFASTEAGSGIRHAPPDLFSPPLRI